MMKTGGFEGDRDEALDRGGEVVRAEGRNGDGGCRGMTTRIVIGSSLDPYLNLAYEEYLVESAGADEAILFLWQNHDTVVIGCNQNPWRECDISAMGWDGVKLARRVTGGGAVFHDMGNLNFSFIVPRARYDVVRQGSVIIGALRSIGIAAEQTGRNDITIGGRKFSGNAFMHRKTTSLHHGTILILSLIHI